MYSIVTDKLHYALAYIFILYFSSSWMDLTTKLNSFVPIMKRESCTRENPKMGEAVMFLSRKDLASEWKAWP